MAVSLAIGLIVIVAALNIVTSLILLVMEKGRDIAILKTMGTSALIFMMQGRITSAWSDDRWRKSRARRVSHHGTATM